MRDSNDCVGVSGDTPVGAQVPNLSWEAKVRGYRGPRRHLQTKYGSQGLTWHGVTVNPWGKGQRVGT
jgi:hypothetical protein